MPLKFTDRTFLPYGRQCIEDDDIAAVVEVLSSDYLTGGPVVDAFEAGLVRCTDAAHAIAVSSGTAALNLAATALELGPGDVAIIPTMTFLATANAALHAGAEVEFADVDSETGLLTPETLQKALDRTELNARVVLPVHLNGQTVDLCELSKVPGFQKLRVIEDACHALGSRYTGQNDEMVPVGSNAYADMSVFSFHPVKTLAMGEGGVITTNDSRLAERLRRLSNIGMTRDPQRFEILTQAFDAKGVANPWYYEMAELGFNYRASAIHCALGLSQLGKLNDFVSRRAMLMARYRERLKPFSPTVRPLPLERRSEPAWHLCVVAIDFAAAGIARSDVMHMLQARRIGTQVHYIPVHRQPFYQKRYGDLCLPGADAYYEKTLSLPLFVSMEVSDVDYVVDALAAVLGISE